MEGFKADMATQGEVVVSTPGVWVRLDFEQVARVDERTERVMDWRADVSQIRHLGVRVHLADGQAFDAPAAFIITH